MVGAGFIVDYISHPVINSFTTAAAITIACSQLKVSIVFDKNSTILLVTSRLKLVATSTLHGTVPEYGNNSLSIAASVWEMQKLLLIEDVRSQN